MIDLNDVNVLIDYGQNWDLYKDINNEIIQNNDLFTWIINKNKEKSVFNDCSGSNCLFNVFNVNLIDPIKFLQLNIIGNGKLAVYINGIEVLQTIVDGEELIKISSYYLVEGENMMVIKHDNNEKMLLKLEEVINDEVLDEIPIIKYNDKIFQPKESVLIDMTNIISTKLYLYFGEHQSNTFNGINLRIFNHNKPEKYVFRIIGENDGNSEVLNEISINKKVFENEIHFKNSFLKSYKYYSIEIVKESSNNIDQNILEIKEIHMINYDPIICKKEKNYPSIFENEMIVKKYEDDKIIIRKCNEGGKWLKEVDNLNKHMGNIKSHFKRGLDEMDEMDEDDDNPTTNPTNPTTIPTNPTTNPATNIPPVEAGCGNGICESLSNYKENPETCPLDCGIYQSDSNCGNGICDRYNDYVETYETCPEDCRDIANPADCYITNSCCGNGICEVAFGENRDSCSVDCSVECGDNICVYPSEDNESCPEDCEVLGDSIIGRNIKITLNDGVLYILSDKIIYEKQFKVIYSNITFSFENFNVNICFKLNRLNFDNFTTLITTELDEISSGIWTNDNSVIELINNAANEKKYKINEIIPLNESRVLFNNTRMFAGAIYDTEILLYQSRSILISENQVISISNGYIYPDGTATEYSNVNIGDITETFGLPSVREVDTSGNDDEPSSSTVVVVVVVVVVIVVILVILLVVMGFLYKKKRVKSNDSYDSENDKTVYLPTLKQLNIEIRPENNEIEMSNSSINELSKSGEKVRLEQKPLSHSGEKIHVPTENPVSESGEKIHVPIGEENPISDSGEKIHVTIEEEPMSDSGEKIRVMQDEKYLPTYNQSNIQI